MVNLFEFQLGSDPNNSATPAVVRVAPSGADHTDVATAIDAVDPGTVIRVAGGSYAVNYRTFSEKVVMIQGGWSPDFSERELSVYPTSFDGGLQDEVLYFSIDSGSPVIILDGLHLLRGKDSFGAVNLSAKGTAVMKTSILNTTIMESESTFGFGSVLNMNNSDTSTSDRTIANTVIGHNGSSGVRGTITDTAMSHWRIINTTISNNLNSGGSNGYGIDTFTLGDGVLTARISNSIIWGNEQADINIRSNITFEVDHSDIGNVNSSPAENYLPGAGVINVDPLFADPANGDFRLGDSSPAIDAGINLGVPTIDLDGQRRIFGPAVDMGAYEFGAGKRTVGGNVRLEGMPNPITGARITFSTDTTLDQVTTDPETGDFEIQLLPGFYNIAFEKDGFLTATIAALTINQDMTLPVLVLLGGDVNGNGVIDRADLTVLAGNIGKAESPW